MTLRTLRRGKQRLYVHRGVEADCAADSTTPSEPAGKMQDEMGRLEQVRLARCAQLAKVDG